MSERGRSRTPAKDSDGLRSRAKTPSRSASRTRTPRRTPGPCSHKCKDKTTCLHSCCKVTEGNGTAPSPGKAKKGVIHQNEAPRAHNSFITTIVCLMLLSVTPIAAVLLIHIHINLDGAITPLINQLTANGIQGVPAAIWKLYPAFDDMVAWKIIGGYAVIEAFLQVALPGKKFLGPVAPSGHVPVYKANGMQHYFVANILFFAAHFGGFFDFAIVYDHFLQIITYLSFVALGLCAMLYFKGIYFPSTPDSGSTGNPVFDFYEGTELYPRIFGFDVKVFTNCRFGMMAWTLLPYVYAIKQYQIYGFVADSMIVSVLLQQIYCAKFFWWETGYFWSIDIILDRAGYMICWGCLVWVPSVYTGHTLFMVKHPLQLGYIAWSIFAFGLLMIILNYDADRQRYDFRQNHGKNKVWGKDPVFITAHYTTESGDKKTSTLLASGYWGIARHLQYDFELGAAFAWCAPAMFTHPLPYLYFVFLTILLVDRAHRDDHKCTLKYGRGWQEYKKLVPYNMIPGIY